MKKIGYLFLKHIEKIMLAFCMVILIVAIGIQLKSLKSIRGNIKTVLDEATKAGEKSGGRPVPVIDDGVFDLLVEVREPWKPSYTLGTWDKYEKEGSSKIFKKYTKPPAILSDDYKYYLEKFGPGSMFDPPLYVTPADSSPKLIAFESTHSYEPPYRSDLVTGTIVKPHNPDDPNPPEHPRAVTKYEPGALVRLYRVNSPMLPFKFMTAMGQQAAFQVGNRQKIIKGGDTISGEYSFLKIESKKVNDWKTVYLAVIQNAEGQEIKMPANTAVPDPFGESSYDLRYYPKVRSIIRKKNGDALTLSYGGKTVTYQVTVAGNKLNLVEVRNGQPTNISFNIGRFSSTDYRTWVAKVKAEARAANPGAGDPMMIP